ncbi:MAG: hypothetical protein ACRELF_01790 [Gemmataceae bacterium]
MPWSSSLVVGGAFHLPGCDGGRTSALGVLLVLPALEIRFRFQPIFFRSLREFFAHAETTSPPAASGS